MKKLVDYLVFTTKTFGFVLLYLILRVKNDFSNLCNSGIFVFKILIVISLILIFFTLTLLIFKWDNKYKKIDYRSLLVSLCIIAVFELFFVY